MEVGFETLLKELKIIHEYLEKIFKILEKKQPLLSEQNKQVYLTVKQFSQKHPWVSEGGLRHVINFAEYTEFKTAIKRCGRKVLIDEDAYLKIISNNPALKLDYSNLKKEKK